MPRTSIPCSVSRPQQHDSVTHDGALGKLFFHILED